MFKILLVYRILVYNSRLVLQFPTVLHQNTYFLLHQFFTPKKVDPLGHALTKYILEDMLSLLGLGMGASSDLCLVTIMRILFPMPPEPQSVIKKATSDGNIVDSRLENVEGEIRSGKLSKFRFRVLKKKSRQRGIFK